MIEAPIAARGCCWTLVAMLSACTGPAEFTNRPAQPIAWPASTATPRVELEFAYAGTHDSVRHPGFFAWLASLIAGDDEQQFISPSGMARHGDTLWVADPGAACVHRISMTSGEHARSHGHEGHPFATPIGVAALPDGGVVVTDAGTGMVTVLDGDGAALRCFGGRGVLERPTGICHDRARGRLLIVDTVACRIVAFDTAGKQLETAGTRGTAPGEFNYPTNLALTADGRVLVVDSLNFRIQVLSAALQPIGAFGRVGRGPGDFANPKGIAVDSADRVYVVDSMFDNFQIFDLEGQLLLPVGHTGQALGELYLPTGLHIDADDRIYVADAGNSRIQVMRLHTEPTGDRP